MSNSLLSKFKILKSAWIKFPNIKLNTSKTHLMRGYFGNAFKEFNLIHNHNELSGKEIYRYPLIQFKVIENTPIIIAFTEEAIEILQKMLLNTENIDIKGNNIPVKEKMFDFKEVKLGWDESFNTYEFVTPWLALNQLNYKKYTEINNIEEKNELLKRNLIANIISMCKSFNYTVPDRLLAQVNLTEAPANLKGQQMIGFTGYFKVNFELPDYIGLGKSVSRGYGSVKKLI